jgi:hypothetical protein
MYNITQPHFGITLVAPCPNCVQKNAAVSLSSPFYKKESLLAPKLRKFPGVTGKAFLWPLINSYF